MRRSPAWLDELRELLRLAVPLALTHVAQMAIALTDTVMLARYSSTALAASVLGNTVFLFCLIVGRGPGAAVAPMIAQALGADADDRDGVRAIVRMGFWAVALVSVPLIVVLLFTRPLLLLLGQNPGLSDTASHFAVPLALGLPFALGFQVLRSYVTAIGRPRAGLLVMVLIVAWNFIGDYALIFGHFGAPRLGLVGSGLASAGAYVFGFVAMAALMALAQPFRSYALAQRAFQPAWRKLREIGALGLPMSAMQILESGLYLFAHLAIGAFGAVYVAAHAIAWNVQTLTSLVPTGIGLAATVRVGLAAGAGDAARIRWAAAVAMYATAVLMSLCGIGIALYAREIASLYVSPAVKNAAVVALAIPFLRVAAAYQVVDGLQVAAAFALRGLKEVRIPLWLTAASFWAVGFPACIGLAFVAHLGALGIWIGMAVALFVAAAALSARLWQLLAKSREFNPR